MEEKGQLHAVVQYLVLWEGAPGTNWIGGSLRLTATLNA